MRISDHAFNRLSVLKILRASEPISRTELAQRSGLNGGTITAIIRDLQERGLVLEKRVPSTNRGRPKVNLRINPEGAFVVGATMTADGRLLAEIADLRGRNVHSHSVRFIATNELAELAQQFSEMIDQAIAGSPIARDRISQIGIGLPAIVDSRTGIVTFFETFEDLPFPFAEAVERSLQIPTRIDNNVNLLARSEHWFGEGTGVDDFTLVLIDLGLAAARYQAGRLLVGSHGTGAEFGHTKIVPEGGRPCHCGALGCLQAYSSMSAIVYQVAERSGEAPPAIHRLRKRFTELTERAKSGDPEITDLFKQAGSYLGRGLANHINMQDPDRIVVLARSRELVELIWEPLFEALHQDTLPVLRDVTKVRFKEFDETNYATGAAAMVLEQLYSAC